MLFRLNSETVLALVAKGTVATSKQGQQDFALYYSGARKKRRGGKETIQTGPKE